LKQKWQGQQQNQWNNKTNDGVINNSSFDIIIVIPIFSLSFHHLHHFVIVLTTGNECFLDFQVVPKFEFSSHFHIRHVHHQTLFYHQTLIIFSSLKTFIKISKQWVCQLKLCKSFLKSKDLGATKKEENKKRTSLSKENKMHLPPPPFQTLSFFHFWVHFE
jgi:hypothetical protein